MNQQKTLARWAIVKLKTSTSFYKLKHFTVGIAYSTAMTKVQARTDLEPTNNAKNSQMCIVWQLTTFLWDVSPVSTTLSPCMTRLIC